jgi:hypothetical protein
MAANSTIAPSTAAANGPHDHTTFLQNFAAREAEKRAANDKPTLSVEQHAVHRAQLGKVRFIKPKYSAETEINVSGIFNKWSRYVEMLCQTYLVGFCFSDMTNTVTVPT